MFVEKVEMTLAMGSLKPGISDSTVGREGALISDSTVGREGALTQLLRNQELEIMGDSDSGISSTAQMSFSVCV